MTNLRLMQQVLYWFLMRYMVLSIPQISIQFSAQLFLDFLLQEKGMALDAISADDFADFLDQFDAIVSEFNQANGFADNPNGVLTDLGGEILRSPATANFRFQVEASFWYGFQLSDFSDPKYVQGTLAIVTQNGVLNLDVVRDSSDIVPETGAFFQRRTPFLFMNI